MADLILVKIKSATKYGISSQRGMLTIRLRALPEINQTSNPFFRNCFSERHPRPQ